MEKGGEMVMVFVSGLELMFCFPFSVSPDSCACNFVSPDTFLGNFLSPGTCACNFLSHLDSAWTTYYPAPCCSRFALSSSSRPYRRHCTHLAAFETASSSFLAAIHHHHQPLLPLHHLGRCYR